MRDRHDVHHDDLVADHFHELAVVVGHMVPSSAADLLLPVAARGRVA